MVCPALEKVLFSIPTSPFFAESFALAPDRTTVLKSLVPGTQDYYYYNILHLQNSKSPDVKRRAELLEQEKHKCGSEDVEMLRLRQQFMDYDTQKEPEKLKFVETLKQKLGVSLTDSKEVRFHCPPCL